MKNYKVNIIEEVTTTYIIKAENEKDLQDKLWDKNTLYNSEAINVDSIDIDVTYEEVEE